MGERICTWVGCEKLARHEHRAKDGSIWCDLCDAHHEEVEAAVASPNAKRILSTWVKAKGGAHAAMLSMGGPRG